MLLLVIEVVLINKKWVIDVKLVEMCKFLAPNELSLIYPAITYFIVIYS